MRRLQSVFPVCWSSTTVASSFESTRYVVKAILPLTRIGVECPGSSGTRQRNVPAASKLSGNGPVLEPATPSSERKYLGLPSAELASDAVVVAAAHKNKRRRFLIKRGMLAINSRPLAYHDLRSGRNREEVGWNWSNLATDRCLDRRIAAPFQVTRA